MLKCTNPLREGRQRLQEGQECLRKALAPLGQPWLTLGFLASRRGLQRGLPLMANPK